MRFSPVSLSVLAVVASSTFAAADDGRRDRGWSERPTFYTQRRTTTYDWPRWGGRRYEDSSRSVYEPRGYRSQPSYDYRGGR